MKSKKPIDPNVLLEKAFDNYALIIYSSKEINCMEDKIQLLLKKFEGLIEKCFLINLPECNIEDDGNFEIFTCQDDMGNIDESWSFFQAIRTGNGACPLYSEIFIKNRVEGIVLIDLYHLNLENDKMTEGFYEDLFLSHLVEVSSGSSSISLFYERFDIEGLERFKKQITNIENILEICKNKEIDENLGNISDENIIKSLGLLVTHEEIDKKSENYTISKSHLTEIFNFGRICRKFLRKNDNGLYIPEINPCNDLSPNIDISLSRNLRYRESNLSEHSFSSSGFILSMGISMFAIDCNFAQNGWADVFKFIPDFIDFNNIGQLNYLLELMLYDGVVSLFSKGDIYIHLFSMNNLNIENVNDNFNIIGVREKVIDQVNVDDSIDESVDDDTDGDSGFESSSDDSDW